jgi:hypothetical protein
MGARIANSSVALEESCQAVHEFGEDVGNELPVLVIQEFQKSYARKENQDVN